MLAALVFIPIASLIAVTGLSVALRIEPNSLAAVTQDGLWPDEETIRVGLLYGPSAVGEVTVRAEAGSLVTRSEEDPDGIAVPGPRRPCESRLLASERSGYTG